LDRYYSGAGAQDPVLVTLPHRLYVPQFQFRNPRDNDWDRLPEAERSPAKAPERRFRHLYRLGGSLFAAAVLFAAGYRIGLYQRSPGDSGSFVLTTRPGDVTHQSVTLPGDGIRLAHTVAPDEEIMGRMVFTPNGGNQHAGLLVFSSPDQFVKFGRRFWSRVHTEFGIQSEGRYTKPPGTFAYDPTGQDGSPVWISIRRSGDEFQAFQSTDGSAWRKVGSVLKMRQPMNTPRLAVFAMQEAVGEPSALAEFSQLGSGLAFHHRPDGLFSASEAGTWTTTRTCPSENQFQVRDGALEFQFTRFPSSCAWELSRAAPAGDWSFSTKLDLLGFDGAAAGLSLTGKLKKFRLVRWAAGGGAVSAQLSPGAVTSKPDFKGSPPLWLRLEAKGGKVSGGFSRDNRWFERLPLEVDLRELGANLQVGLHASAQSWTSSDALPVARFEYVKRDVLALENFR
jgi:hypothetical protein